MNSNDQPFVRRLSRREMLRYLAMASMGAALAACGAKEPTQEAVGQQDTQSPTPTAAVQPSVTKGSTAEQVEKDPTQAPESQAQPTAGQAYLAAARGQDPAAITESAIKALGGMERFVKQGFDVIIKPNICTDYYSFEYGATTNPVVVATLVTLALGAGAKRVRVMDYPFGGTAESAYVKSGIGDAVKQAGGEMEVMNPNKFKKTDIPQGKAIKNWEIYQEALTCDLLIDVGIAKHHSLAIMTAAQKNLMGLVQNRNGIHANMSQRLADLLSVIRPGLTLVDAVRTLLHNGPTGGNLDDVKLNNLVIASHDTVACDSYATRLFKYTAADIPYIGKAADMGLGVADLSSVKVEEINV